MWHISHIYSVHSEKKNKSMILSPYVYAWKVWLDNTLSLITHYQTLVIKVEYMGRINKWQLELSWNSKYFEMT